MPQRRASDALWLELREALVTAVPEHHRDGPERIWVHDEEPFTLRLQKGQHVLDLNASRELVTCTMRSAPNLEVVLECPIGLRPGTALAFRMNGQAMSAEAVSARLLEVFLERAKTVC